MLERYLRDVTIRFNSDRLSGGAWLVTHARDTLRANAEIGIAASWNAARQETQLYAHIGNASLGSAEVATAMAEDTGRAYCHQPVASLEAAIDFLARFAILRDRY